MKYIALIYQPSQKMDSPDPGVIDRHVAFTREALERGAYLTCDALAAPGDAVTVRIRDGKVSTSDGPFAETKEVLGGFYMLECAGLDEAVALAAKIPGADTGCIEVRPINVIPGWDDTVAGMRSQLTTARR